VTFSSTWIRAGQPRGFKLFVLILAIAATLNITLASTSPAHLHLDSSSPGRCDLCFTANTTVFETPAAQPIYGPEIAGRTALILPFFGYEGCNSQPHCSRGPPYILFVIA
jgi:hypothetical protein